MKKPTLSKIAIIAGTLALSASAFAQSLPQIQIDPKALQKKQINPQALKLQLCDLKLDWPRVAQGRPTTGNRFDIAFRYQNVGRTKCAPFSVQIVCTRTVDGAGSGYQNVGRRSHIPGLAPGQSHAQSVSHRVDLPGRYRCEARTNPARIDNNPRNNRGSGFIDIAAR